MNFISWIFWLIALEQTRFCERVFGNPYTDLVETHHSGGGCQRRGGNEFFFSELLFIPYVSVRVLDLCFFPNFCSFGIFATTTTIPHGGQLPTASFSINDVTQWPAAAILWRSLHKILMMITPYHPRTICPGFRVVPVVLQLQFAVDVHCPWNNSKFEFLNLILITQMCATVNHLAGMFLWSNICIDFVSL